MLWRMDRREFLSTLVGGVFVNAAVRTWPFRVFSFPSRIVIPAHLFEPNIRFPIDIAMSKEQAQDFVASVLYLPEQPDPPDWRIRSAMQNWT